MADIVDILRLEIDDALRDIGRVEQALDRALAPVEVDIEVDERALAELENTLNEVQRIADRAATETQSIALAAGRAEVNFEDLARAMGITEAEARDLTTELLQSQAASNRLEDSARDVARQLGLSENEANRLTSSLRTADRAAEAIDVTAVRVAGRFTDLRVAAAGIATALAAVGTGQLFSVALRGANSAIQSFAQLEDSINAVNVVFGTASAQVLEFGESAAASAGLSASAFNQAVVPIGSLLRNFGFDAREAADAAVILVQRAADLASVFGGSVNDALAAVGAGLRGEINPLERYGAGLSAVRVEQFALAQGLAATKAEITPAITLQARYGLILSDTARVAGDFANTSDDLANAQRSAGAAVQNFVTDIGESLAPAFETILVLLPEVLEGLRQLVPGFANAADSAAAFFEAVGEGGGFREEGAQARAFFDALTSGPGIVAEAAQALGGLGVDLVNLDEDFTKSTAALVRGGALLERSFTRSIGVGMARALDSGADAVEAFDTAIRQTAAGSSNLGVFTGNFRDLSIAANLTQLELRDASVALIENRAELGLTADEVAFLTTQVALLNSAMFEDIEAVREFNRQQRELDDIRPDATRFVTFAGEIESSTDRAAAALAELSASAERQQARTAAAFNLFEELPEQISGSFSRAVDALREQVEAISDFEINIAILEALDLDALADDFREKGIAAAGQLADAVNNIPLAIEADELLEGVGVIGEEAFNALVERFISVGLDPADARELAEKLSSPQVIDAAEEAGKSVGAAQAGAYHDSLTEELDQLIPDVGVEIGRSIETHWRLEAEANDAATETANSFLAGIQASITPSAIESVLDLFGIELDLTDIGIAAGGTLMGGIVVGVSSPSAVDRLRDSIVDATNNALEARSPSRVMLDLGESAGDAFWQGFNQADLTLRTAVPSITGSIAADSIAGGVAGVNVNINLDHASLQDPVSDVARMAQIAGSVAQTFNAVRS